MEPMSIFWLAVMIVMLAVEAATANLVSIWFAGGALAAFIAAMCDGSIPLQIILFIALSGLLLLCLWPLRKKLLRREKPLRANADRVIGMTAVVTEAVDNIKETGAVKVDGKVWTARSIDGSPLAPGDLAKVQRIEGVKLIVEKVPAEVR